jgi:hypothetical protein
MAYRAARVARIALASVGLGVVVSACSMGNMFTPAPSGDTVQLQNQSMSQEQIAAVSSTALPAIATECPPIKVRPGSEALFKYAGERANPRELNWQAIIENQSRNCVVSNGKITMKMGVVGRLLLGPAGSVQGADLPLRFAIERDGVPLFSEKYDIPVQIAAGQQSAEFVKVVENVEIPYLGGEQITVWVGFDPKG